MKYYCTAAATRWNFAWTDTCKIAAGLFTFVGWWWGGGCILFSYRFCAGPCIYVCWATRLEMQKMMAFVTCSSVCLMPSQKVSSNKYTPLWYRYYSARKLITYWLKPFRTILSQTAIKGAYLTNNNAAHRVMTIFVVTLSRACTFRARMEIIYLPVKKTTLARFLLYCAPTSGMPSRMLIPPTHTEHSTLYCGINIWFLSAYNFNLSFSPMKT